MSEEKTQKGTFGMSQQKQLIVVGALGAILGGLLLYRYVQADASPVGAAPGKAPKSAQPKPAASPAASLAVLRAQVEPLKLAQPAQVVIVTRDPFEPAANLLKIMQKPEASLMPPGSASKRAPVKVTAENIKAQAAKFKLKGIFGGESDPIAFINGRIVRPNSSLGEFTVVAVVGREVIIEKNGVRVTLKMAEPGLTTRVEKPEKKPINKPLPLKKPGEATPATGS